MFKVSFSGHEDMVMDDMDIMDLQLEFADNPAHQAALIAFVNSDARTWTDTFGKSPAYWTRLNS